MLDLAHHGDPVGAAMASRTLASLNALEHSGRMEKALDYLHKAQSFAEQRNSSHEMAVNELHFARLYTAHGKLDFANDHLERARLMLSQMRMNWHTNRLDELHTLITSSSFNPNQFELNRFNI